ncbi:MAG: flagellar basal body-associated FliL family protein [Gallionellaceae bacterium]
MAKPAKPVAAKKDAAVTDAPKSSKKKLIIIILVVLLAGGVSAWYFLFNKHSGASTQEHKVEIPKDPTFIPLDVFTVNLQHEDSDQYLQISFSFKVFDPEIPEKIDAVLPEIRSKLNLLLSSKFPSELSTVEGKKKLAAEIVVASNRVLGIRNAPQKHSRKPASSSHDASEADAADSHGDGEVETDVVDHEATDHEAADPEATDHEAVDPEDADPEDADPEADDETEDAPAPKQKRGVVDVMFTSFIIQ